MTSTPRPRVSPVARGYSHNDTASRLAASVKTVGTHASAVLLELQLWSRPEMTRRASDRRLI